MYHSYKLDVNARALALCGLMEVIMRIRRFGKALALFAVAMGLVLAGCNQDAEDEGGSGGGSGTTKLVEGEWTDGKISKEGQLKKYTFEVSKGARYFIWLNDSDDGDRTKDADIGLKISHEDGTAICNNYNNATSLYTKPLTFSASSTGTVTITAAAYKSFYGWEQGTGSYAIKYTSRPEYDSLSEGDWKDDTIIATGQTNKYTFTATEKRRYFIYLDDTDTGSGITTKTADIGLKITRNDGTAICNNYDSANSLYSQPYTFISSNYDTITITAAAYKSFYGWEQGIGTYAIRYTSRPEYITLSTDNWYEDDIITNGQTNKYYISVTAGKSYSIYLDDTDAGNGITTKTADVGLKIFYNGGTVICNNYNDANSLYTKPYTFIAPITGIVTITAAAYKSFYGWEQGTGTYAIRYTISDSN